MRVRKCTVRGGRYRRMDLSIVSLLSQAVMSPWMPVVHILVLKQLTGSFKRVKPGEHVSWLRAPRGHKFCWRPAVTQGTEQIPKPANLQRLFQSKTSISKRGVGSCCSVSKLCPSLCDPMDCSRSGSSVLHGLPEFTQTHVHWVGDVIQPSHPLFSPSPAPNLSLMLGKHNLKSKLIQLLYEPLSPLPRQAMVKIYNGRFTRFYFTFKYFFNILGLSKF